MTRQRLCPVPVGLAVVLDDLSISGAAVCRHADLPPRVLVEPRLEITATEYLRLWDAIGAVSRDPAIGLAIGTSATPDALEPVLLAALSSRDLDDALRRIATFKRLLCNEEVTVDEGGDRTVVRYHSPDPSWDAPACLVDAELAFLLNLGRRGTRFEIRPLAMHFQRRDLAGRKDAYLELFGCEVMTGQPDNAIVLAAADLERPFVTFNAPLLALLDPQLETAAARLEAERPTAERVREALGRLTAGNKPTVQTVATTLAMSPRSLQRQLQAEGTSFVEVLASTRRVLAEFYLTETPWSPAEIAYLVGYEDTSSFYRAFQSWTGQTPGNYRAKRTP